MSRMFDRLRQWLESLIPENPCPTCAGRGILTPFAFDLECGTAVRCPTCRGTGERPADPCLMCGARGRHHEGCPMPQGRGEA